jgi:hypothetical protein
MRKEPMNADGSKMLRLGGKISCENRSTWGERIVLRITEHDNGVLGEAASPKLSFQVLVHGNLEIRVQEIRLSLLVDLIDR